MTIPDPHAAAPEPRLDARLLKGLSVTVDDLVAVVTEHWCGAAGAQPCKLCGVPKFPSFMTAQPLLHGRRLEVPAKIPHWMDVSKPVLSPRTLPASTRRRASQAEELFDAEPYRDYTRVKARKRRPHG